MGNKTDQDEARMVGDRLAPPTTPDKDTIREDRAALDTEHRADREPTPDEETAADRTARSAGGEVGDRYEEMLERGVAQEGEGKPGL
jgi:hypothetical protein